MREMPNKTELKLLNEFLANDNYLIVQDAQLVPAYGDLMSLVRKGYLDFERSVYNCYKFELSDIVIECESDLQFLF